MNTAERLQKLKEIEVQNIVSTGEHINPVVLSFSPKIIIFQNFKPNEIVTAKFSVQNISKVSI